MIESGFEAILHEVECNSNIYSNDITTTIADELREHSSRRSDEINEYRESIYHKMQLLNCKYNREIQSLSNDYNKKINLLRYKSDDELLKKLYNNNKPNDELKYDTPDYDWEYRKHNNSVEYSKIKFDIEFKKHEEELKKLEQERHNVKHLMHEYDQWKKCEFNVNYVFKDSSKEFTLLHFAASFGDTNVAKLLLEQGVDIDVKDQNGNTSLHLAALNGHTDIVKLLLEKGSDLSVVNKEGNTFLHLAAFNGHIDTVKFLLEEGSDLSAVNKYGDTPLNTAFYNDQRETVKYLIEKEPGMKEVVEDLVKSVVESKTHKLLKGSTSLHLAAAYDCTEIVESLLKEGENPLSKDMNGKISGELATDEHLIRIFKAAEIKQQEYDATKWGIVSGVSAVALGTTIASTLFATVLAAGFLPIVGAIAAVTVSALTISGATYMALKPNTE